MQRSVNEFVSVLLADECVGSRRLAMVVGAGWFLRFLMPTTMNNLFALVPSKIITGNRLQTLFTAGYYDTSLFMGAINLAVLVAVAPFLERGWTTPHFIKFVMAVNALTIATVFFFLVLSYSATSYEPFLYSSLSGFSGVNAAFAVALKQRFGDRAILPAVVTNAVPWLGNLKFAHLPSIIWPLATALWCMGRIGGKESPLVMFGTFWGWFWLRFYAVDPDTQVVGDLREDFSFASLFPDMFRVRTLVQLLSTIAFQTLYRLGFFAAAVKSRQDSGPTGGLLGRPLPHSNTTLPSTALGTGAADPASIRPLDPTAERRRQLAIKAIEEKLKELQREQSSKQQGQPGAGALATVGYSAQPQSSPAVQALSSSSVAAT